MARPSLIARMGAAVKAFWNQVPMQGGTGVPELRALSGLESGVVLTQDAGDQGDVGQPWANSAVMICLGWILRTFSEARFRVMIGEGEDAQEVRNHPLPQLLRRPNPYYSGNALWAATNISYHTDGNAYWLIFRDGAGVPRELWYAPHWMMEPRWPKDGSQFVSHYEYTVGNTKHTLPPEDVVHFRYGLDPENTRKGMAPLKAGLKEIGADNLATVYSKALLRNTGAIPGIISPADPNTEITDDEREKLLQLYRSRVAGKHTGLPLVAAYGMRFEKLALSPEEMVLDRIRQVPEARIAALIGVAAMTVGLSVGENQRTYSNQAEAREASYETCIIPSHVVYCNELDLQLLPLLGRPDEEWCDFDYSRVRCLQEDQDALHRRAGLDYQNGIITRGEARAMIGRKATPEDDVYFVQPQGRPEPLPADDGS